MIWLYKRTNTLNNKIYIGQTSQIPEKRWKHQEKENTYLGNSLRKYGPNNFLNTILMVTDSKELANKCEFELINILELKTKGYNRRDGGNQGTISEETRKKLSDSHIGQLAWNKGVPLTEETKNKIRETRKNSNHKPMLGKTHSDKTKEKLRKFRIDFKFTKESKKKMSDSAKLAWNKRKLNNEYMGN